MKYNCTSHTSYNRTLSTATQVMTGRWPAGQHTFSHTRCDVTWISVAIDGGTVAGADANIKLSMPSADTGCSTHD